MTDADEIADVWQRTDPDLDPAEKETTIRWARDEDTAVIHTDERGVGRRVIRHDHSTIESVNVLLPDGTRDTLAPEAVGANNEVIGVRVRLPIGVLSIKSNPRNDDGHANVVSDAFLRADGGRYLLPSVGDPVQDRESDDRLVVTDVHPATAANNYPITEVATVADHNDDYEPSAPVVDAVYVEEVGINLPEWRSAADLRRAADDGKLTIYSFPADRLAPIEEGDGE